MRSSVDLLQGELHPVGVDSHRLGAVVRLVNPHQPVRQLKHVVSQRDYDELRVLCPLLKHTSVA